MNLLIYIAGGLALIAVITAVVLFVLKRTRSPKLNPDRFQTKWRDMQKLCSNKETWPQAIVSADKILEDALKTRRFAGRTIGERLTKAQHTLTNNEGVWFGHKLRSKVENDPNAKLKEKDVKQALVGIRQALKDLGAFRDDK